MSDLEARATSWQWQDAGSGPGHMQAVSTTKAMRADAAYRAFLDHAQSCKDSCSIGVNCSEAAALQRTWRDAKNEAAV